MSASARDPALDDRLARALAPYLADETGGVLLAVSGGPDSTALLHAAAGFRRDRLFIATVDHGLRPEAAEEAADVARACAALGLPHRTLAWDAPQRGSRVQEAARAARYRLLAAHARAVGAGLVLTAHTRDDQAETVLMRLIAGSGPAGLAGMPRERWLDRDAEKQDPVSCITSCKTGISWQGVRLARPFLDLQKADLVAYCEAHAFAYLRDPSNADPRFARARLRHAMPLLAAEGLTPERLVVLARRLARDDAALARRAEIALSEATRASSPGTCVLDGKRLAAKPEAIVLRAIDAAIDAVGMQAAGTAPRRLERLERLVFDALLPALENGRAVRRTLRGVLVEATQAGELRLSPAPPRRATRGCVADNPDLLGKGEGAAYIGRERPGHVAAKAPLRRDEAGAPPRIDR